MILRAEVWVEKEELRFWGAEERPRAISDSKVWSHWERPRSLRFVNLQCNYLNYLVFFDHS